MSEKSDASGAIAEAIAAARAVLHEHMAALNAQDEGRLVATLHFPHYRLTQGRVQTWDGPEGYLAGFRQRAGGEWARSSWDFITIVAAGPEKVHCDVSFTRFRADGSILGVYRSLWVIARLNARWAAQFRSSFAG